MVGLAAHLEQKDVVIGGVHRGHGHEHFVRKALVRLAHGREEQEIPVVALAFGLERRHGGGRQPGGAEREANHGGQAVAGRG